MKKTVLWILLADGGNARVIERVGPLGKMVELHNLTHSHESTSAHGPDRPGRTFESSGPTRHAYGPHTDWHDQQKDHFAKELVHLLKDAHLNKKYDELYILAPAKMLGFIRQHINHTNQKIAPKVSKEVTKDAIALTLPELEEYLNK
jgi:protein required for attachment to host cells